MAKKKPVNQGKSYDLEQVMVIYLLEKNPKVEAVIGKLFGHSQSAINWVNSWVKRKGKGPRPSHNLIRKQVKQLMKLLQGKEAQRILGRKIMPGSAKVVE